MQLKLFCAIFKIQKGSFDIVYIQSTKFFFFLLPWWDLRSLFYILII